MLIAWVAVPLIGNYQLHPFMQFLPLFDKMFSINVLSTIFFFGLVIGALIWVSLTLAQATNIHLLIWNAPFEKNVFTDCLIPGTAIGSITSVAIYITLRILLGNDYLHRNAASNLPLLFQLILIIIASFFTVFSTFFITSFILWTITRISEISRTKAISTTIMLTAILVNIIPLINIINSSESINIIPLILSLCIILIISLIIISYSLEAAILANIIVSVLIHGLSIIL